MPPHLNPLHTRTVQQWGLLWPEQAENLFAELFSEATQGSMTGVWVTASPGQPDLLVRMGLHQSSGFHTPDPGPFLSLSETGLLQQALNGELPTLVWSRELQALGDFEQALLAPFPGAWLCCCALQVQGQVFGVLYAVMQHLPGETQQARASEIAEVLTLALQRQTLQMQVSVSPWANLLHRSSDLLMTLEGYTITSINPACEDLLGHTPADMVGRSFLDFMAPEDWQLTQQMASTATDGSIVYAWHNRYVHKEGHLVHLEWSAVMQGNQVFALGRNITERVEAAQALSELFLHNPLPMWVFDEKTLRFLEVNQAAVEKYGHTREAFLNMTILDIRPPEDRAALLEGIQKAHTDFSPGTEVYTHLTHGGEMLRVRIHRHRILHHGVPSRLVVVEDVTEQEQVQLNLQQALAVSQQLIELAEELESTQEPADVIEAALRHCTHILGLDYGLHFRVKGGKILLRATVGSERPFEDIQQSAARYEQERQFSHYLPQMQPWPMMLDLGTHQLSRCQPLPFLDARRVILLPIFLNGTMHDVLVLGLRGGTQPFTENSIRLLNWVKDRVVRALERNEHLEQLSSSREETLKALGVVLEYRDYETKGHTDRVVQLSGQLGKALGLSESDLDALRWGAYLHDTGKVAIPDHILLKPGKLTPEEYDQVKKHSEIGFEMLRNIDNLPETTLQVVLHHHERWDGNGYPGKLAGTAIPLAARIFSVIDVYDALVSRRPYKEPMAHEDALAELCRCANTMFDPTVVQAFCKLFDGP